MTPATEKETEKVFKVSFQVHMGDLDLGKYQYDSYEEALQAFTRILESLPRLEPEVKALEAKRLDSEEFQQKAKHKAKALREATTEPRTVIHMDIERVMMPLRKKRKKKPPDGAH